MVTISCLFETDIRSFAGRDFTCFSIFVLLIRFTEIKGCNSYFYGAFEMEYECLNEYEVYSNVAQSNNTVGVVVCCGIYSENIEELHRMTKWQYLVKRVGCTWLVLEYNMYTECDQNDLND